MAFRKRVEHNMPFAGLGLHILLALFCPMHVVRCGQQLYWLIILFSFPLLGSVVYFFVTYLPNSRPERGAMRAVWAAAKVAEFQRLPPFNPPRSIERTLYQGKVVFHISPACCDIPSELYDDQGALLCFPTGGFAGGDGRRPGFRLDESQATPVRRDTRPR